MDKIRLFFNLMIVASTSILIGVLAFDKLNASEHKMLTEISLQTMHVSLLIGVTLNLIHFIKNKMYLYSFLTALPLALFAIALIAVVFDFQFSFFSLIVFDFYLIFWFFFLSIREIVKLKGIKFENK